MDPAYTPEDLCALRVYCCLCFCQFPSGAGLTQKSCGHVFCATCTQETIYGCPYDGQTGMGGTLDVSILDWVEWVVQNPAQARDPSVSQYLPWLIGSLQASVRYAGVPCRQYYYNIPCSMRCPYGHSQTSVLSSTPCPQGFNCRRGQLCPYFHGPAPMSPMPPSTYQTYPPATAIMPPIGQPPQGPIPGGMQTMQPNRAPQLGAQMKPSDMGIQQKPMMPAFTAPQQVIMSPSQQVKPPPQMPVQGQGRNSHRPPAPKPSGQPRFFQYHRPARWYDPTKPCPTSIQSIPATDKHFKEISALFGRTSGNQIVKIERIYNYKLYTNYAFKHEAFSRTEGRAVAIKHLFHGTRGTDPRVIYDTDTGLDSRVGGGMWGQGTYYAVNSSYSVNYASVRADGKMQMFCCSVIVGDTISLPSTPSLIRPPQKPNSTGLYHSVQGNTQGSDVFITYEPAMSYPSYLITFV